MSAWTYCVEVSLPLDPKWLCWQAMYGRGGKSGFGELVDIDCDVAVQRCALLPRHGGKFAYRVRPFRPASLRDKP